MLKRVCFGDGLVNTSSTANTTSGAGTASAITDIATLVIGPVHKKRKIEQEGPVPNLRLKRSQSVPCIRTSSHTVVPDGFSRARECNDLLDQKERVKVSLSLQEMVRNSKIAIEEHERLEEGAVWASPQSIEEITPSDRYVTRCLVEGRAGKRPYMEDAALFEKVGGGHLVAVFDGHGGSLVAKHASKYFGEAFVKAKEKCGDNIPQALEIAIEDIQKQVVVDPRMRLMGSTLVASYIKDGIIYTATVGDSEAFFYEKNSEGELASRPLSIVRNWAHPEEANRAVKLATTLEEVVRRKNWINAPNPKTVYLKNRLGCSINLSGSIGDPTFKEVSIKPRISVAKVKEGGRLVLMSDGVGDEVSQSEMLKLIKEVTPEENLALKIMQYALDDKKSKDNVMALVLNVE